MKCPAKGSFGLLPRGSQGGISEKRSGGTGATLPQDAV